MAITDKKTGPWGLDQVYNKINQGSIWEYSSSGALWSLGQNDSGQLGHNNETKYSSPTQKPGTTWPTTDDRKLSVGDEQTFVVTTDGTLWTWGKNQWRG